MLGVEMCEEARSQEAGVLAIFGAERIHGLIEMAEPLQADDFAKQVELPVVGFAEMMQDDSGGTVEGASHKHRIEGRTLMAWPG
jgi:hypothetical protein